MPWKECSAVSCREEFVRLARAERAKMSELCRRFGVSRKTGYKGIKHPMQTQFRLANWSRSEMTNTVCVSHRRASKHPMN